MSPTQPKEPKNSSKSLTENYRKKRRIVPDEKRKRALFSCDRCKQRKIKCNRIKITEEGGLDVHYDNTTRCLNCEKANSKCVTQLPRKKRQYYQHTDRFEFHFQVLMTLVGSLCPELDPLDTGQLISYGRSKNIHMPDYAEFLAKSKASFLERADDAPLISLYVSKVSPEPKSETETNVLSSAATHSTPTSVPASASALASADYGDMASYPTAKKLVMVNSKESEANGSPKKTVKSSTSKNTALQPKCNDQDGNKLIVSHLPQHSSTGAVLKLNDYGVERLVYDLENKPYYVGYASTGALFSGVCSLVLKDSLKTKTTTSYNQVYTYSNAEIKDYQQRKSFAFHERAPTKVGEAPLVTMASDLIPLWAKVPDVHLISKEEADFYVEIFFSKIHHYYYIFSEDTFRERYKQFWLEIAALSGANEKLNNNTNENDRFEKISKIRNTSSNWIFCIYLVWILGAEFKPYPNGELNGELIDKFVDLIKLGLPNIILRPSLLGIRCLYLLAVHYNSCRNKNSAWMLIGIAGRQAISLGLHRDTGVLNLRLKRPISLRKQIWWSVYIFEVTMGSTFGRPSIIVEKDINIGYPSDIYVKPGEEDFLSYYLENIKLTRYLNEIFQVRRMIYDKENETPLSLNIITKTLVIRKKLLEFKENLKMKRMDSQAAIENLKVNFNNKKIKSTYDIKRYKLDLSLNYNCYMITMSLPFILYVVNILVARPDYLCHLDEPIIAILTSGIESAIELSKLLYIYHELDILEGNLFSDIFFGYIASMVLVLVFIMFKTVSNMDKSGMDTTNVHHLLEQLKVDDGKKLVDINLIMQTIYRTRLVMTSSKIRLGTTIQRAIDVVERLLHDIGIVSILDKMFATKRAESASFETSNDGKSNNNKNNKDPVDQHVDDSVAVSEHKHNSKSAGPKAKVKSVATIATGTHGTELLDGIDVNPEFAFQRAKRMAYSRTQYNDMIENNYKNYMKLREITIPDIDKQKLKSLNVTAYTFQSQVPKLEAGAVLNKTGASLHETSARVFDHEGNNSDDKSKNAPNPSFVDSARSFKQQGSNWNLPPPSLPSLLNNNTTDTVNTNVASVAPVTSINPNIVPPTAATTAIGPPKTIDMGCYFSSVPNDLNFANTDDGDQLFDNPSNINNSSSFSSNFSNFSNNSNNNKPLFWSFNNLNLQSEDLRLNADAVDSFLQTSQNASFLPFVVPDQALYAKLMEASCGNFDATNTNNGLNSEIYSTVSNANQNQNQPQTNSTINGGINVENVGTSTAIFKEGRHANDANADTKTTPTIPGAPSTFDGYEYIGNTDANISATATGVSSLFDWNQMQLQSFLDEWSEH